MITINILLFHLFFCASLTSTTLSRIRSCYVETYIESLTLGNCLNTPINIEATRCDGHCYSEEYLTDDWEAESISYKRHHVVHCCSPNVTITRQIPVLCSNKQRRIIQYPFVTQCECKTCHNDC